MLEEQNKEEFIVRNFKEDDYEVILKLWDRTGLGGSHRGDNLNIINQTINHGGFFLVLEHVNTGRIIGTAWITNDYRRLYVHHFGIDPEYQGKGLSHLLAKECIRIGKQLGLQMKLEVHKENIKARKLYEKYGFTYLEGYEVMIIRKY